ncbi:MAG: hypothetical protein M1833_006033 [Piccolia ochrophora]|nr:MAG: hypothetical protein M1833_006033 [Piccolia ochrophora]
MFEPHDTRWLLSHFPAANGDADVDLLQVGSGVALMTNMHARREIKQIIFNAQPNYAHGDLHRLKLSDIASHLDVDERTVLPLLPPRTDLAGWFLDEPDQVITRSGYLALVRALHERLRDGVVSTEDFIDKHQITKSTLRRLANESNKILERQGDQNHLGALIEHWRPSYELIFTQGHRESLEDYLKALLQGAQDPVQIDPQRVEGSPPLHFLFHLCTQFIVNKNSSLEGTFRVLPQCVEFVPKVFQRRQQHDLLERLRLGSIDFLSYDSLQQADDAINDPRDSIDEHCKKEAIHVGNGALSRTYFQRLLQSISGTIGESGYAVVNAITPTFSREGVLDLTLLLKDKLDFDMESLTCIDNVLISRELRLHIEAEVEETAKQNARDNWPKPGRKKGPVLVSDFSEHSKSGVSPEILRKLLGSKAEAAVEQAYNGVIHRLQDAAISEFSQFWSERVMGKALLYRRGIESLEDQKLRDDLSAALIEYMLDTILPDNIKRAEAKGLFEGARLEQELPRLAKACETVKTQTTSADKRLSEIYDALGALAQRLNPDLTSENVPQRRKPGLLHELTQSMQKDENGPRLFLTLLVILLATRKDGMIYATGKFAPRLLKQLRNIVDREQLASLTKWKDAAKSGSMSKQDHIDMRQMAETAILDI